MGLHSRKWNLENSKTIALTKEKVITILSPQKQSRKISQAIVDHIKLLTPKVEPKVNLTKELFNSVQKL